jgi:hypothetical protein
VLFALVVELLKFDRFILAGGKREKFLEVSEDGYLRVSELLLEGIDEDWIVVGR